MYKRQIKDSPIAITMKKSSLNIIYLFLLHYMKIPIVNTLLQLHFTELTAAVPESNGLLRTPQIVSNRTCNYQDQNPNILHDCFIDYILLLK